MGHRWSFERGGFSGAPAANTVFVQANTGSEWNLVQQDYADANASLSERFQKYLDTLAFALTHRTPDSVAANGQVTGEMLATGPANAFDSLILYLLTRGGSPSPMLGPQPRDAGGDTNGAYAWLPLVIPANVVTMSFEFKIQGDW